MSRPLISVCIPTYNHEAYIRDCILSVLFQDIEDIEILVGDDHSTDETTEIVRILEKEFEGNIRHIHREKNVGPSENLRLLVLDARGLYVAHLDGDDFWQAGKLKSQLSFLQAHGNCVACYTNAWVVGGDLSPLGLFNGEVPSSFDLKFLLRRGNFLNHSSILYRAQHRDCVIDCQQSIIDYRIHISMAMRGMLGYINTPYVTYRNATPRSVVRTSSQRVRMQYLEALLYAFDNNDLDDIYEIALIDFVARTVKDGMRLMNWPFFVFWYEVLCKNIKTARAKILLCGLVTGVMRALAGALKKAYNFPRSNKNLRIFHER